MNFDSIPFEEPELFRARSGLRPALKSLAKDCASLDLQLDSQAPEDSLGKQDQVRSPASPHIKICLLSLGQDTTHHNSIDADQASALPVQVLAFAHED